MIIEVEKKVLLTRAVLKSGKQTAGCGLCGNEDMLEERVDSFLVVELKYDGPVGLGEGPLPEGGIYEFGYESNWTSMAVSKSNPNPCQISSRRVAFSVRTKRHWFLYTPEYPESSLDLSASASSGIGPALASTMPEYSQS